MTDVTIRNFYSGLLFVLVDVCLGCMVWVYFGRHVGSWQVVETMLSVLDAVRQQTVWMMGVPAGFKVR